MVVGLCLIWTDSFLLTVSARVLSKKKFQVNGLCDKLNVPIYWNSSYSPFHQTIQISPNGPLAIKKSFSGNFYLNKVKKSRLKTDCVQISEKKPTKWFYLLSVIDMLVAVVHMKRRIWCPRSCVFVVGWNTDCTIHIYNYTYVYINHFYMHIMYDIVILHCARIKVHSHRETQTQTRTYTDAYIEKGSKNEPMPESGSKRVVSE